MLDMSSEGAAFRAVQVLNRALEEDPVAIKRLFAYHVDCNDALADDQTIQVRSYSTRACETPTNSVGVLGLINGLFGVRKSDGYGWVEAEMDDDGEDIVGFRVRK